VSDCQALLAQFCARGNTTYYDFFLSPYGYYSLVLAYDKHQLTKQGFLTHEEAFHLQRSDSYLEQLLGEDQRLLQAIVSESTVKQVPGLFSNYLFTEEEMRGGPILDGSVSSLAQERAGAKPCLFTLGYEGLSIDAYLNLLLMQRIAFLVDVRKNPWSRKYGFSKKQLLRFTSFVGIEYRHLPALGISSSLRHHLDTERAYQELFEHYTEHILPAQQDAIEQLKHFLLEARHVALTCFEANPQFCHRHRITEYLLQTDSTFHTPIIHLRSGKAFSLNRPNHVEEQTFLDSPAKIV